MITYGIDTLEFSILQVLKDNILILKTEWQKACKLFLIFQKNIHNVSQS